MEVTAKRLLELRKSANLSQVKMAEALGISQSALNRYEHDQQIISEDNEEIRQFIEMCFDPKFKMSVKLKDTLYQMMAGGGEI